MGRKTPCPDREREGEQAGSHEVQTLGKTPQRDFGETPVVDSGTRGRLGPFALCYPAALTQSVGWGGVESPFW